MTALAKSLTRVRFVVPTSTNFAPDCVITSGIRNPPPISTSSPRETATDSPPARAARTSITAEAQLLTTIAASAPQALANNCGARSCLEPRSPVRRSSSRFVYRAELVDTSTGARPMFVCNKTPVALITSVSRLLAIDSAIFRALF